MGARSGPGSEFFEGNIVIGLGKWWMSRGGAVAQTGETWNGLHLCKGGFEECRGFRKYKHENRVIIL